MRSIDGIIEPDKDMSRQCRNCKAHLEVVPDELNVGKEGDSRITKDEYWDRLNEQSSSSSSINEALVHHRTNLAKWEDEDNVLARQGKHRMRPQSAREPAPKRITARTSCAIGAVQHLGVLWPKHVWERRYKD